MQERIKFHVGMDVHKDSVAWAVGRRVARVRGLWGRRPTSCMPCSTC